MGSFVTDKVGNMEKTKEVEIIRMRKDLVGCVQASQLFTKI